MSSYRKTMRQVREEMLVISEAKYELYHKDFSTAMQHAYKMAKKLHGITVDPKEIDDKVASGPRKPSEGKTNSYRLEGDKGSIQVQVYNKGGPKPFELNFYKEEVELDEVGGSAFGGTIDKIQKVVDDKQATKIDGVMVDTFTASLIMKIWNGVSKQNQDKMRKMKVTQLAKAAYKLAGMKEEVDLDEGTKQVLAHGGKGQYKAVRDGSITKVMYKGKVVGTADFDSGADSFFVSMKGVKGQKSFDDAQAMVDYFAKNKITEEVELDEIVGVLAKGLGAAAKGAAKGAAKVGGAVARKVAPAAKVGAKKVGGAVKKSGAAVRKDFVGSFGDAAGTQAAKADAALEKKAKRNESLNVSEAEDFKPHKMYDPETGEAHDAKTMEDHLRMKKMGYSHDKPKSKDEGAIGGLIGGAIGAATGGPVGAYKGMKIGSKVGDVASVAIPVAGAAYLAKKGYDAAGKKKKEPNNEGTINEILPALAGMAVRAAAPYVAGYALKKIVGDGKDKKKEKEEKTESAASDARRAMAADPSTKQKFSKNVSATDDDIKSADKNIMMQMRKAVSLRGNKVEFMDKKKVEIPQKVAQAVLDKYNSQKKPSDKEKFQAKVSKSYKSMLTTLKEHNEINNTNNSLHELKSLAREMKGKNNG